jgi:hypothetical protein
VWVARGTLFAHAFELRTGETPDEAAARAWQRYRRWTSWIPVVTSGSALWNGILALAFIAFYVNPAQAGAAQAAVGRRGGGRA